jgi:hypothetical protein
VEVLLDHLLRLEIRAWLKLFTNHSLVTENYLRMSHGEILSNLWLLLSKIEKRRRRMKWENDNLVGLHMFLTQPGEDADDSQEITMKMSWQNLFSQLLLAENESALRAYLACSTSFVRSNFLAKSLTDCADEWDRAEFAWSMIEKRLRAIVVQSIKSPETQNFITTVEDLLLACEEYLHSPQEERGSFSFIVPSDIEHLFRNHVQLIFDSNSVWTLDVRLADSAYHRVLLHTTCQFHGNHSKVNKALLMEFC